MVWYLSCWQPHHTVLCHAVARHAHCSVLCHAVLCPHLTGDEGATLLAQKLSGNGLLVTLDIGSNGIGDVGAAALAEGLKLNTTLQKLDLR